MEPTLKDRLRAERLAARRAVADDTRLAETVALIAHLRTILGPDGAVAAYVPLADEPGFPDLPDALLEMGAVVLLPIARAAGGVALPLQWSRYRPGELIAAPYGLREPAPPWLPPSAIGTVATVLIPALAVDRRGIRLGRGAGYYDRSLPLCDGAARLIAVARDDELVDDLPAEPHDVAMTHALVPGAGLVALG